MSLLHTSSNIGTFLRVSSKRGVYLQNEACFSFPSVLDLASNICVQWGDYRKALPIANAIVHNPSFNQSLSLYLSNLPSDYAEHISATIEEIREQQKKAEKYLICATPTTPAQLREKASLILTPRQLGIVMNEFMIEGAKVYALFAKK